MNGYKRGAAVVFVAVFAVAAGLAAPVTASAAATHHRPVHPLKCARGKSRVFVTGGRHPKLVAPARATALPSRGQRQFCLKTSTSATAGQSLGTLAATAFAHAVAQLPKKLRPHLRRLGPAFARAVAASFTASEIAGARRREAASTKAAPTTFNVPGKDGGSGTVAASTDVDGDTCPSGAGKLHGTYDLQVHAVLTSNAMKGALTLDFTVSGTYDGDVADNGEPTHVLLGYQGEEAVHVTLGGVYDYARQTETGDIDVPLPSGTPVVSNETGSVQGSRGLLWIPDFGDLDLTIVRAAQAAKDPVTRKLWQYPSACATITITADQKQAPTGGQLQLTLRAAAQNGDPLTTQLTLTTPGCPGTLSDSSPTTNSGTAQVTLTDDSSQWIAPARACVEAEMQTRAGQADEFLQVPAQAATITRLTGSLTVHLHYATSDGPDENETDDWTGTAQVNEANNSGLPASTYGNNVHNSQLSLSGSWSALDSPSNWAGNATGSNSGLDESDQYLAGARANFAYTGDADTFYSPPVVRLDLTFTGDGSEQSSDCGSSSGPIDLLANVVLTPPAGGNGAIAVNRTLVNSQGDQENGWQLLEPSDGDWTCAGSPATGPPTGTASVSGNLTMTTTG